jgi:glycosyltransferase involved in cell wall biosynthesis
VKIVFVRGPHLGPWEAQAYRDVAARHDFTVVGADWGFHGGGPSGLAGAREATLHAWGAGLTRLGPRWPILYNRALSRIAGRSLGLDGLAALAAEADVVHGLETFFTITHQCLRLRRRGRPRVAATVWETLPGQGETHPWRRAGKRRVLDEADAFLAVTATARRVLLREGAPAGRVAAIPMAVDTKRFAPAPPNMALLSSMGIAAGDLVVLFVGRLVPEKGVRELLAAYPLFERAAPGRRTRLVLAGDGPLRTEVLRAAAATGGGVIHRPPMPYATMHELYNAADLCVLPSKPIRRWEEQFGYALVEAMASGVAVVGSRSGAIPEVTGDAGVLVAPGEAADLATAVARLLAHDAKRAALGRAARNRAEKHFSLDVAGPRLLDFYGRLDAGRPVAEA